MKKKEVIYYEGNAFPSPVDDRVELKEGNKGIVDHGNEVQLSETKLKNFWNKMDEINIWNWEKDYSPMGGVCDGHVWELRLRSKEGKAKVVNGHQEYPHNFNKLIKALNDLFGSKIEEVKYFDNENEIIELHAQCFGWELFVSLVNNKGSVFDSRGEDITRTINDFDRENFWKKIEELGVWNWYSKYPHKKPKYESLPDQVGWELKIINHEKYKLCKGYDYFPKNFKEFTKELSNLIGVEFKIQN